MDISRYSASGYEVWRYGLSSVKISTRSDQVIEWDNTAGNLKVVLRPGANVTSAQHFTRGSHKDDVLRLQGTPVDITRYPALGFEVWRYGLSSVRVSLASNKVVDFSDSGEIRTQVSAEAPPRSIRYHQSLGDVTLYYDEDKVYEGALSFTDDVLGQIYGFTDRGVVHFYDSSFHPLDLYAYPTDGNSLEVGTLGDSRSEDFLSGFRSRLSLIDVTGDVPASGTAMRFGNMTFYDIVSNSGTSVHGHSIDFGTVGFDDFYSTTGASVTGNRIQVGNFSFGDWSTSEGTTISGTSHRIGSTVFHTYSASDGTTYTGTTLEIGDFSFTDITGR